MPMLVGTSRKGFLGKLTGRQLAKDRDVATAATTVAAIEGGADIIRVHNIPFTRDAVAIADALYKPNAARRQNM